MTTVDMPDGAIQWLHSGERGISSEAIFDTLVYGSPSPRWYDNHPLDVGDFYRCEMLLRAVPAFRERLPEMAAVSETWARLVDRWSELTALIEDEIPGIFDDRGVRGRADRAYAIMRDEIRT